MKKFIALCSMFLFANIHATENFFTQVFVGQDIQQVDDQVKNFVIHSAFVLLRSYPYLYAIDENASAQYFNFFSTMKDAATAVLFFDNQPIGYMRGLALSQTAAARVFDQKNQDLGKYYYVGEIFLNAEYSKKDCIALMVKAMEEHAKSLGYEVCFIDAEYHTKRHVSFVLQPSDYQEQDYHFLGYEHSSLVYTNNFPTIQPDGEIKNQMHVCEMWIKNL
jgi:hypothetical protein